MRRNLGSAESSKTDMSVSNAQSVQILISLTFSWSEEIRANWQSQHIGFACKTEPACELHGH